MPSTYSSNLKIELMSTGENSGTWGNITNTNLGTALEQAIVGYGAVSYASDANLTISITNSNAAQAARALVLNVTSAVSLTATRELVVPTSEKQYIVQNNTTGSQSITVKTSAGTGITVPNGRKAHLYVDGTNVIQMFDFVDINGGTIDGTAIGGSSAAAGAFTTLNASGATTLDGNVTLGNASGDNVTVTGTITSHLLFTDNTYDIGASGATRPRNLFLAGAATIGGNLSVGGTLTLTGGLILNGNVTVGDSSADTLTVNATITSNLLFTDNTYDIGASGATRPRNLFLAGNATVGGNQTLTGSLTVDSTTDSSSTTTGSIQTDGGLGVAKALYVGTTANIAGNVTLSGGTANGVAYLNGSKVLTTGSALTFDGTNLTVPAEVYRTSASSYLRLAGGDAAAAGAFVLAFGQSHATAPGRLSLGTSGTGTMNFDINGSEQMRLTSTGLGIGTSSPAKTLHVSSGSYTYPARIQSTGGATTGIELVNTGSSANPPTIGSKSDALFFETNNAERMRLDSSGNLGIGTSSPGYKLGISGVATTYAASASIALYDTISGVPASRNWLIGNVAAGNYGELNFAVSSAAGGAPTNSKMTLDSSGNLGLGVTPSAWTSFAPVLQIKTPGGGAGAITGSSADNFRMFANAYYDGSYKRYAAGYATQYEQASGAHAWYTAATSTANSTISFTQAMTLDASGNLQLGATSGSGNRLNVVGTGGIRVNEDGSGTKVITIRSDFAGIGPAINVTTNDPLLLQTNNTERARIDSSGRLLVGTTSSFGGAGQFAIDQSGGSIPAIHLIGTQGVGGGGRETGATFSVITNDTGPAYSNVAKISAAKENATQGNTAGYMAFSTTPNGGSLTERARITSGGDLLVGRTSAGLTTAGAGVIKNAGGAYLEVVQSTNGVACMYLNQSNGSGTQTVADFRYNNTQVGTINVTSTACTYNNLSDYRLKTVIGSVSGAGARIDALEPVEYEWKVNGARTRGFLAHKFQEVYPQSVAGEKDAVDAKGKPVYQSMQASTSEVIADLVAEIQSLRKRLAAAGIA